MRLCSHRYIADLLSDSGPKVTMELAVRAWRRGTCGHLRTLFPLLPQDNFAAQEAHTDDGGQTEEEQQLFFDKLAQVGEEEIMNMLQDEIAVSRARAKTM